jgi:uncharacterized membrane protein YjgN (DUF898 family)
MSMPNASTLELVSIAEPAEPGRQGNGATGLQAGASKALAQLDFQFTGTGAEYFRIWIVNLLLTILTFGVYSAWAKVRRLQYFYRNTKLDGAIFDYHGNPKAILKGRILALVLIGAYKIAFEISGLAALLVAIVLFAMVPWLLARSFRFKMINSSYRGLRFRFGGTAKGAYRMLSLFPLLAAFTIFYVWNVVITPAGKIGLLTVVLGVVLLITAMGTVPLAHFLLKRFQHDNAYFGQTPVFFDARAGEFFKIYGAAIGLFLLGSVPAGVFAFLTRKLFMALQATMFGWLFALFYGVVSAYAFYLFVRPFLESRIQNLVWNHTELAGNRFVSSASGRKLFWLHASNLMLITLTLGMFKPFAVIRLMKYRIESLSLVPEGNLEEFLTDHAGDNAGALGQEAGDLFDLEIAL